MKCRVFIRSELARIGGEPVRLYRAVVEQRPEDWLPWEFADASLLYDKVMDCQRAGVELQELYLPEGGVNPLEVVSD